MRKFCSYIVAAFLLLATLSTNATALTPQPGELFCRVVDVGAGQCCVIVIPGKTAGDNHYIVYDAGNYEDKGKTAIDAITQLIPNNERIDLLVLSHTDSDHIAAVPDIVDSYFIDRVLRTGQLRQGNMTKTLTRARKSIQDAVNQDDTMDLNLEEVEFPSGATWRFGDAYVTFVCGFGEVPDDWNLTNNSEINNATSIVIRVQFKEKSILLCGDAVGRHNGDPANTLIATENFMVEQKGIINIDSDVIVAPHHGADNGSSEDFIEAVSPDFVIFSAGSKHKHPRHDTAERYLNAGVDIDRIFRTDRGDNEGGKEWLHGNTPGKDPKGDDDVDIAITNSGTIKIEYRN